MKKQPAHLWDYKIPEKQETEYYKSSLVSDILAVLFFQYFPSKHPLLMRKGKKAVILLHGFPWLIWEVQPQDSTRSNPEVICVKLGPRN